MLKIDRLLNQFIFIPVDARVSDLAAYIRRTYHLKLGDSIIAATSILMDSSLVTRNLDDFKRIKELRIIPL